jgi:hypothetical protein
MTRLKQQKNMKNSELYQWLFHYNPHTETWNAFNREDHFAYWNGLEPKYAILRAKDISIIQEIIKKTDGEKDRLNELTRRVEE